jgi:hypothetical protein
LAKLPNTIGTDTVLAPDHTRNYMTQSVMLVALQWNGTTVFKYSADRYCNGLPANDAYDRQLAFTMCRNGPSLNYIFDATIEKDMVRVVWQ